MATSTKPLVIAISGPTASGKTTLAQALVERFTPTTHVKLISQDNFYLVRHQNWIFCYLKRSRADSNRILLACLVWYISTA